MTPTERERCPVCDFPLATTEDAKQCAREGAHLGEFARNGPYCWVRLGFLGHRGPAIDWRARALKAEKTLRDLRHHFVCRCNTSYTARDRHAPECLAYDLADLDAVLDEVAR